MEQDCHTPDTRGKALGGSVLSLDAIGLQENYTLGNESHFLPPDVRTQYNNARIQHKSPLGSANTKYIGNTVKHVFKPKEHGDLLSNMYLKTKLPVLSQDQSASDVVIEFPSEFSQTIQPGSSIKVVNSELKRLEFSETQLLTYTGTGYVENLPVSNVQYAGIEDSITGVPVGRTVVEDFRLAPRVFDEEFYRVTDPNSSNFILSTNVSVSNATITGNSLTVDGGFQQISLSQKEVDSFSGTITNIDSKIEFSATVDGALVPMAGDLNSLIGKNISAITTRPEYGNKFVFTQDNFTLGSHTFTTTVTKPGTYTQTFNGITPPYSNVSLSSIIIDPTWTTSNVLSVGNFEVTYVPYELYQSSMTTSNVFQNIPGFFTSNVTITDTPVSDTLLWRSDFSGTPSTSAPDPLVQPADTLSLYSSLSTTSPSALSNIVFRQTYSTPVGSTLDTIQFSNVSTNSSDYRLDGSYVPFLELSTPDRNAIVNIGAYTVGTNFKHAFQVNSTQVNSTLNVFASFTTFSDSSNSFSINLTTTGIDIVNYNGDTETVAATIPSVFLESMKRGNLNITKHTSKMNAGVSIGWPMLRVYDGVSLLPETMNIYSNTTTLDLSATDSITVKNGTNTVSFSFDSVSLETLVSGNATHATYESTAILEYESRGHCTATGTSNTFPVHDEPLVLTFLNGSFDNSVTIQNSLGTTALGIGDLPQGTVEGFVYPNEVITIPSGVTGNVVYDNVLNTVSTPGMNPVIFEQKYDVLFDLGWLGGTSNVVTIRGTTVETSNTFLSSVERNAMYPYDNTSPPVEVSYSSSNILATSQQTISASTNGVYSTAPFSFVEFVVGSASRDGMCYDRANKLEVFPPTEFMQYPEFASTYSNTFVYSIDSNVYTGPITCITNDEFVAELTYTQASANVWLDGSEIMNTTMSTNTPRIQIDFESYPNVLTLNNTQTYTIPSGLESEFSNVLSNATVSYSNPSLGYRYINYASGADLNFDNRYGMGFAQVGSNVFCIGGKSDTGNLSDVFKYEIGGSLGWDTVTQPPFSSGIVFAKCTASDDTIYMFAPYLSSEGSYTKRLYKQSVSQITHTLVGGWELESINFPGAVSNIQNPGFVYCNDKLYVIGGEADGVLSNRVFYYDITTQLWSEVTLSSSFVAGKFLPSCLVGNTIYFADGAKNIHYFFAGSTTPTLYTLPTKTSVNRGTFVYESLYNKIYIMGGTRPNPAALEYIDVVTDAVLTSSSPEQPDVQYAAHGFYNQRVVSIMGQTAASPISNVYSMYTPTETWNSAVVNILKYPNLRNVTFMGTLNPGDIPLIKSGIVIGTKKTPIVELDDLHSDTVMQIGMKRSNVHTGIQQSTNMNKGTYANWYMDILADGKVVSNAWNGKDAGKNFNVPALWFGEEGVSGNTYPSSVTFASTTDITDDRIIFSNVSNSHTLHGSDIDFSDTLLNYTINGITNPYGTANNSILTITNKFNPYVTGGFGGYPVVTAVTDTDNIPVIVWDTTFVAADVYRQYIPSYLTKSGRLDSITCFYGASKYTPPINGLPTTEYGVLRTGMDPRKLVFASFRPSSLADSSENYMELYKYFGFDSAGADDEVIVSFGSGLMANEQSFFMGIKAGTGTNVNDILEFSFGNYNAMTLTMTVVITYRSSSTSTVLTETKDVALNMSAFGSLSDSFGRSGDVTILSTHNAGVITSNVSTGTRPESDEVLKTCLSAMDDGASIQQENVFAGVFPVKISMNKYVPDGVYTNNVGRALIEEASIQVGGQEIERIDDLGYVMRDELFKDSNEKSALDQLINGGEAYLPTSVNRYGPIDLYIPLEFFFHKKNMFLPLCSMYGQDVTVTLKFSNQEYFSNTSGVIDLDPTQTFIVTEEIIISDEERFHMQNTKQRLVFETIQMLPKQLMNLDTTTHQKYEGLISSFPMKAFMWLFRSEEFEHGTSSDNFLHRYNFSSVKSTKESDRLYFEFLKECQFFMEGVPIVERYGTNEFFKYYQSSKSNMPTTDKNIYNFSFALTPVKSQPSGSLNLQNSSSNKTYLDFLFNVREASPTFDIVDKTKGVEIHAWAYGYKVLEIENNVVSLKFS